MSLWGLLCSLRPVLLASLFGVVLMLTWVMTSRPSRPHVLLITIDTLRPDALGWVAHRNATPHLDTLATQGVAFSAAVAPAPLTLPSHTSIMTGLLPRQHGVQDNGQLVDERLTTLAEVFREQGYATGAVIGGFPLRAMFGLDQGFDHYDDAIPSLSEQWLERPAADVSAAALTWLRALRSPPAHWRSPWFLWVHYYNPHDPYTPLPAFIRAGPRGDYDGEVAGVDDAIGTLRRGIAELVPDSNILTVVTADHGESLGEHGEITHGFFLYDSTILVPLIFHFPGHLVPAQSRAPARLIDIAPTLLDLLAYRPFSESGGISLRPLLVGDTQTIPPAYLESRQPWLSYGWAPLVALRTTEWKLIDAPRTELYSLQHDPAEAHNRIAFNREVVSHFRQTLHALEEDAPSYATSPYDVAAMDRLRGLGYIGGGMSSESPSISTLADPKDRLMQKYRLDDAEAALQQQDYVVALATFDTVLAAEPDNRYALLRSGVALQQQGRYHEAISRLEQLLRLMPTHPEARYALADALSRIGEVEQAVEQWQALTQLQPRRAAAWSNLGAMLLRNEQIAQAVDALTTAVSLEPANAVFAENLSECQYALARAEARAKNQVAARGALNAAVTRHPALRQRARRDPLLAPVLTEAAR